MSNQEFSTGWTGSCPICQSELIVLVDLPSFDCPPPVLVSKLIVAQDVVERYITEHLQYHLGSVLP